MKDGGWTGGPLTPQSTILRSALPSPFLLAVCLGELAWCLEGWRQTWRLAVPLQDWHPKDPCLCYSQVLRATGTPS